MQISITACEGVFDKPLKLDVLGLEVDISELDPDKKIVICDKADSVFVTVKEVVSLPEPEAVTHDITEPEPIKVEIEETLPVEEVPQVEGEPVPQPEPPASHDELYSKLSDLRKRIAVKEKLPAYTIFKNKTLQDMCEALPQDTQALKAIQGVGDARLAKYGDMFLDVIREHIA